MSPLKDLFDKYTAELHVAKTLATEWWSELLAAETARTGSPEEAERLVASRWPFGAASHPYVIATFRKYFVACEQLNDELQAKGSSAPTDIGPAEQESDWGVGDDGAEEDDLWDVEGPIGPEIVLIEALSGRDDELSEFMDMYMFACVGEVDNRSV